MRQRLARHIVTVCATVLLTACGIVSALWLRSGSRVEELRWGGLRGEHYCRCNLVSDYGNLRAEFLRFHKAWAADAVYDGFRWNSTALADGRGGRFWSRAFDASHSAGRPGDIWAVQVPHWFAVLVCLPLPWRSSCRARSAAGDSRPDVARPAATTSAPPPTAAPNAARPRSSGGSSEAAAVATAFNWGVACRR